MVEEMGFKMDYDEDYDEIWMSSMLYCIVDDVYDAIEEDIVVQKSGEAQKFGHQGHWALAEKKERKEGNPV